MKRRIGILKSIPIMTFLLLFIACNKKLPIVKENIHHHQEIDRYITDVMLADEIPGLAIAVMKDGELLHKKNYGYANIEHKVPVSDSTLFRIYSTSKLMAAVGVFQLIENGKLTLEDSISLYIDDLPDTWKNRKVENLLTHSSGLPDNTAYDSKISNNELFTKLYRDPIRFKPGNRFEYNQTNYWLLQLIIEKVTGQKFQDYIKENQFAQKKEHVVYASNSLLAIPNRVAKYQYNKANDAYEMTTFEAGERSYASNGLNISLDGLIVWNSLLDTNQLLGQDTKEIMMSPFDYTNEDSFAHGFGIYGPKGKTYYGFAGGGVSALMKFPEQDITIVILSNGFKNRPVISNAINYISGLLDESLIRKDRMLNEDVRLAFILKDFNTALGVYKTRKSDNPDISFERALTEIGYYYMSQDRMDNAISVLKVNTEENPSSANAFDSLAEGYYKEGQYDLALKNYEKAVVLGGTGGNAMAMIKKIKAM